MKKNKEITCKNQILGALAIVPTSLSLSSKFGVCPIYGKIVMTLNSYRNHEFKPEITH